MTFVDQGTLGGVKGTKLQAPDQDRSLAPDVHVRLGLGRALESSKQQAARRSSLPMPPSARKTAEKFYCKEVGEVPVNAQAEHAIEHLKFNARGGRDQVHNHPRLGSSGHATGRLEQAVRDGHRAPALIRELIDGIAYEMRSAPNSAFECGPGRSKMTLSRGAALLLVPGHGASSWRSCSCCHWRMWWTKASGSSCPGRDGCRRGRALYAAQLRRTGRGRAYLFYFARDRRASGFIATAGRSGRSPFLLPTPWRV